MNDGKIFLQDIETGEYKELGELKEVHIVPADEEFDYGWRFPLEPFTGEFTVQLELSRKDKRFWLEEVFMVKKYAVTETLFPRKKKRGSMRRRRKAARNDTST